MSVCLPLSRHFPCCKTWWIKNLNTEYSEFFSYGFRIGQSRCLIRKSKSGCCLFQSFLPFRPSFSFPSCPLESRNLNLLIPASLFHALNEGSSLRVKVRKRTVVCIIDPSTSPSIQFLLFRKPTWRRVGLGSDCQSTEQDRDRCTRASLLRLLCVTALCKKDQLAPVLRVASLRFSRLESIFLVWK